MKTAIFLFIVGVISCYTKEVKDNYYFPKESSDIFIKAASKCVEDSAYDSSVIDQIGQGKYIEEENTVNVMYCACVNTGFAYADGKLNVEKVMKESFPTRQDVRPIVEECNQDLIYETPVVTFKGVVDCLEENLPFKMRFPL